VVSRRAAMICAALIAVMFAAGAWALLHVSGPIATHFDAYGRANGWATPARAFLTHPVIALAVWALLALLPRIDPRGANLARSEAAYGTIWIALTALLCVQQGALIVRALGVAVPASRLGAALMGALFILMGNVMGKVRWNYTVGIRTPWTLADEWVWDRTHRFGGWAFVFAGALLLIAAFAAPPATPAPRLIVPVVLTVTAVTVLKSYLLWRERPGANGT
jgi:immunity protein, SdpI family